MRHEPSLPPILVNKFREFLRSRALVIPLLLVFTALLVQTSWVGDDAFITMRTVDNFVNGHGLRWNLAERVQVFTHPLWMFLLSGAYLLLGNAHLASILLSVCVSAVAFFILLWKVPENNFGLLLATSILLLSKAFVDYSSSGLENPATHLLALGFAILFLRSAVPLPGCRLFLISLMAGLSAFNRMDTLLLYLPALGYLLWRDRSRRAFGLALAGLAPFLAWEVFAIIYYGFPFPNPYYAKLVTGIPAAELTAQGLVYFLNSVGWDPITLVMTFSAVILVLAGRRLEDKFLAGGILLYLGYILSIGGDFMSGRFFTAPLFLGVILLVRRVQESTRPERWAWIGVVLLLGMAMAPLKSFATPLASDLETFDTTSGIADERAGYYRYTNLLLLDRNGNLHDRQPPPQGRDETKVVTGSGVGMLGYYSGPDVYIIDVLALADPLLARLPARFNLDWRIGHFGRDIPEGYLETLETGINHIEDPSLAEYYDELHLIISGDLWTAERWAAIWMMNTGQYQSLLVAYQERKVAQVQEP